MLNQVYRLVSAHQFEAQTIDENLGTDEIIVRPTYLSLCKADQRYFSGNRSQTVLDKKLPMALIHEAIGKIVFDPQDQFAVGDTVAMVPNTPHEKSSTIKENYLTNSHFRSSGYDGFMQEYVFLRRDRAVKIPKSFEPHMAAFTEMISVGVQALTNLKETMDSDESVLGIWGDGNLGYIIASLAKAFFPNSQLIVFGRHQYKLDYFSFADQTYLVNDIPPKLKVSQALECTGGSGSQIAIDQIIGHIQPMGTIILLGVSENPIEINTRLVLERGLTLRGSSRSGHHDFQTVIDILSKDRQTYDRLCNLIGTTQKVTSIREVVAFFEKDSTSSWGKAVMRWEV